MRRRDLLLAGCAAAAFGRGLRAQDPGRAGTERTSDVTLRSEHFIVVYDGRRLLSARAVEARDFAEQGWRECRPRFGEAPPGLIRLDLTPNFRGATGFARPANPTARREEDRLPLIGVRYGELDYLGLQGPYVLTHEIAHVFSGDLAAGPLGEGIADWGAGGFSGIPLAQWWGEALRAEGLWLDPETLFITGEFPGSPEVDAVIRTARYAEAALLVDHLVRRAGYGRFRAFAVEYARVRGPLESNEDRRRTPRPPRQLRPGGVDPRLPPEPNRVRELFPRHFNAPWNEILADWSREREVRTVPQPAGERLALQHLVYGTIRNWEMWLLTREAPPDAVFERAVREAFALANAEIRSGRFREARRALERALLLVERIRRPRLAA
jgi:hypothetical protein